MERQRHTTRRRTEGAKASHAGTGVGGSRGQEEIYEARREKRRNGGEALRESRGEFMHCGGGVVGWGGRQVKGRGWGWRRKRKLSSQHKKEK